jgi:hypothetical protein
MKLWKTLRALNRPERARTELGAGRGEHEAGEEYPDVPDPGRKYDAFGDTSTIFRELEWKTQSFPGERCRKLQTHRIIRYSTLL